MVTIMLSAPVRKVTGVIYRVMVADAIMSSNALTSAVTILEKYK